MSQPSASARPKPAGGPVDGRDHRLRQRAQREDQRGHVLLVGEPVARLVAAVVSRRRAVAVQVEPGAEAAAGAGQDHRAAGAVAAILRSSSCSASHSSAVIALSCSGRFSVSRRTCGAGSSTSSGGAHRRILLTGRRAARRASARRARYASSAWRPGGCSWRWWATSSGCSSRASSASRGPARWCTRATRSRSPPAAARSPRCSSPAWPGAATLFTALGDDEQGDALGGAPGGAGSRACTRRGCAAADAARGDARGRARGAHDHDLRPAPGAARAPSTAAALGGSSAQAGRGLLHGRRRRRAAAPRARPRACSWRARARVDGARPRVAAGRARAERRGRGERARAAAARAARPSSWSCTEGARGGRYRTRDGAASGRWRPAPLPGRGRRRLRLRRLLRRRAHLRAGAPGMPLDAALALAARCGAVVPDRPRPLRATARRRRAVSSVS